MFFVLIALAGAAGASVNAASGRAVMYWFSSAERGFALGVRQTAIPLGGLIAAVALPQLGLRSGLLLLAALCVAGAVFGAAVIHEPEATEDVLQPRPLGATLRDGRLWLLCGGSSFYLVAQVALTGFVVLFLYDERGFSPGEAAAVLAGIQVLAVVLRIGGGRWSDMIGSRIRPLRLVGLASGVTLALVAVLLDAPTALLVAALVVAGGFAMGWNGLSFTAAAELAGAGSEWRGARNAADGAGRGGGDRPSRVCGDRRGKLVARGLCARRRCSRSWACSSCGRSLAAERTVRACASSSGSTALRDRRRAGSEPARRERGGGRGARRSPPGGCGRPGLEVDVDPAGNLFGRLAGRSADLAEVWTGSHLDSVPAGGRFDGALGVVAGLEAVERIGQQERTLRSSRSADEEGCRVPGCVGSRALCDAMARPEAARRSSSCTSSRGRGSSRRAHRSPSSRGSSPTARGELVFEGRAGPRRDDADGLTGTTRSPRPPSSCCALRDAAGAVDGAVATVGQTRGRAGRVNVIPSRVRW